jgi:hypothetical protein
MPDGYISSRTMIQVGGEQKQVPASANPVSTQSVDPKPEYTVSNAKKYMSAELSLQLYGPVPESVFNERKAACMSCELRIDAAIPDSIGFCKGCGCGVSDRSRLSVKLTMPAVDCPKGKFGKAHGRHAKWKDRLKALLIKHLLK